MRSIYLEYSSHPKLFTEELSEIEKQELMVKYTSEVRRLNDIVINEIIPQVISRVQQYLDYLRDSSSTLNFMDKPESTNVAGLKQYRSNTQVLLGGNL